MKVTPLLKEELKKRFWLDVENSLLKEQSMPPKLSRLLQAAQSSVFGDTSKLKLDPKDKSYFIAGSARLYLYPTLKQILDLPGLIDLDVIVPNKEIWNNAGIKPKYKPAKDIEVFDVWDPSKADAPNAKDTTVRPTNVILGESNEIFGYYFMPIYDIVDYKLSLNRQKEQAITVYLAKYIKASDEDKKQLRDEIVKAFGVVGSKEAEDFLSPNLLPKVRQQS